MKTCITIVVKKQWNTLQIFDILPNFLHVRQMEDKSAPFNFSSFFRIFSRFCPLLRSFLFKMFNLPKKRCRKFGIKFSSFINNHDTKNMPLINILFALSKIILLIQIYKRKLLPIRGYLLFLWLCLIDIYLYIDPFWQVPYS